MINEDDFVRLLKRIPFEDMRRIYMHCKWDGEFITLLDQQWAIGDEEQKAFIVGGWTVEEFCKAEQWRLINDL